MNGFEDGDPCDELMADVAEDSATRDHERRVRGEEDAPVDPPETPGVTHTSSFVGSRSEGYIWVDTWMDLGGPDHVEVRVYDPLLDRHACKSIDAETARTLGRYLIEAAHTLDLRAKERREETS